MKFVLDKRNHKQISVIGESLKSFQGAALLACNDAVFTDNV